MYTFDELLPELHGVIRSHAGIRARMQLRRVSRMFHAWDKDLIAPTYIMPPLPVKALKSPSIADAILELMNPIHINLRALLYSLHTRCAIYIGQAHDLVTYPYVFIISIYVNSHVIRKMRETDRIIYNGGGEWAFYHTTDTLRTIWSTLITERRYIIWNRGVVGFTEYDQ